MSEKAVLNNVEKEKRFKYPDVNQLYFDRAMKTTVAEGELWGTTVCGRRGEEQVIAFRFGESGPAPEVVRGPKGIVYKPVILPGPEGPIIYWSEAFGPEAATKRWTIRRAFVDVRSMEFGEPETIHECGGAVYALSAAYSATGSADSPCHYLAWTEIEEHAVTLTAAVTAMNSPSDSGKRPTVLFSRTGGVSFRPDIAVGDTKALLVCDTYRDGRYELDLFNLPDSSDREIDAPVVVLSSSERPGREDEDWNHPKITAFGDEFSIVWLATRDVVDERGIYERHSFLRGGTYTPGRLPRFEQFRDPENPEDSGIIADLREGLLPREVSKGYVGLRRNPQIAVVDGAPSIFWEVRPEADKTSIYGNLVARKIGPDGTVGPAFRLHSGGYCYAVPDNAFRHKGIGQNRDQLPIGYYLFEEEGFDILNSSYVTFDKKGTYNLGPGQWQRWKPVVLPGRGKSNPTFRGPSLERRASTRGKVKAGKKEYTCFWGDTHCHSIFSPDAEGEADELILYARDKAGIDVVSLVDNDFYPHKALTAAEWIIKEELSFCITEDGVFVALPGYEYASHEAGGKSEFNHRCVLYPKKGGKLLGRIHPGAETIEQSVALLKKDPGVIIYPHHCGYRLIDESVERNVEVVSSWRVCIEETRFTWDMLGNGKKLGFIGSSDMHRQVPGLGGALTGILAEELTPGSIADAFYSRRLTATQGSFIFIDFRINGFFIGEGGETEGPPEITARVGGPRTIESVAVIRDGDIILDDKPNGLEHIFRLTDTEAGAGEHWYCLRVKLEGEEGFNFPPPGPGQNDSLAPFTNKSRFPHNMAQGRGPLAWSSPIWVRVKG